MTARYLYRAVVSGLVRRRTITLEWYIAIQTLALGLWVLGVLSYALTIGERLAFLPFTALGLALVGLGAGSIRVLGRGRAGEPRPQRDLTLCRLSMFLTALLWTILTILSALSRPFGLYWPILLGVVIAALWCYSRLYLRFKEED